jgi:hypothetical protein
MAPDPGVAGGVLADPGGGVGGDGLRSTPSPDDRLS